MINRRQVLAGGLGAAALAASPLADSANAAEPAKQANSGARPNSIAVLSLIHI